MILTVGLFKWTTKSGFSFSLNYIGTLCFYRLWRPKKSQKLLTEKSFLSQLSLEFSVHVTVQRNKFLFNKTNRRTNFRNLFLSRNSTCFGKFLCPSSGFFHCTFGTGICHAGLMTYTSSECTVENSWWWAEKLPETCTVSDKNKFRKLVHLLVLLKQYYLVLRLALPSTVFDPADYVAIPHAHLLQISLNWLKPPHLGFSHTSSTSWLKKLRLVEGSSSCILKRCPIHLCLLIFITLTMSPILSPPKILTFPPESPCIILSIQKVYVQLSRRRR